MRCFIAASLILMGFAVGVVTSHENEQLKKFLLLDKILEIASQSEVKDINDAVDLNVDGGSGLAVDNGMNQELFLEYLKREKNDIQAKHEARREAVGLKVTEDQFQLKCTENYCGISSIDTDKMIDDDDEDDEDDDEDDNGPGDDDEPEDDNKEEEFLEYLKWEKNDILAKRETNRENVKLNKIEITLEGSGAEEELFLENLKKEKDKKQSSSQTGNIPLADCNQTLTSSYGIVMSPNFEAGQYPEKTVCNITIDAGNKMIDLNFQNFSMEYETDCRYDYVQIFEVLGDQRLDLLGGRVCGTLSELAKLQSTITAYYKVEIIFKSDQSKNLLGFKLYYDTRSSLSGGCLFGDNGCAFNCHCASSDCHPQTGQCLQGGCEYIPKSTTFVGANWMGTACQQGNVAFGKTASHSNRVPDAPDANILLDGNQQTCVEIQDSNQENAWVVVDLGSKYKITKVIVHWSLDFTEHLGNFWIMHGNTSSNSSIERVHFGCNMKEGTVDEGSSFKSFMCEVTARYISIYKYEKPSSHAMVLCEIEVIGHKFYDVDCSQCISQDLCHEDMFCERCNAGYTPPTCSKTVVKSCSNNDLKPPTNGGIDLNGTSTIIGAKVNIWCKIGYELVGDSYVYCGIDGSWGTMPVCKEIDCGMPPEMENAEYTYFGTSYGESAKYSCLLGYKMKGDSGILLCQQDGKWAGQLPVCEKVDCGTPPQASDLIKASFNSTLFGEQVTYECQDGYKMEGVSDAVLCNTQGNWVGNPPTCVKIDCGTPPTIPNGVVSVKSTTYKALTQIICNEGYTRNDDVFICNENGTWSSTGKSQPACVSSGCSDPPKPSANSIVEFNDTLPGSVALYICDVGYHMEMDVVASEPMSSSQKLTCMNNSEWSSNVAPVCIEACGGIVLAESDPAEIVSPNHPLNYHKNRNCTWFVYTYPGKHISLTFKHWNLEDSINCTYDRVTIRDSFGDRIINRGRYCGENAPLDFVSKGNGLFIHFVSDEGYELTGFRMVYQTLITSQTVMKKELISYFYPKLQFQNILTTDLKLLSGAVVDLKTLMIPAEMAYSHLECLLLYEAVGGLAYMVIMESLPVMEFYIHEAFEHMIVHSPITVENSKYILSLIKNQNVSEITFNMYKPLIDYAMEVSEFFGLAYYEYPPVVEMFEQLSDFVLSEEVKEMTSQQIIISFAEKGHQMLLDALMESNMSHVCDRHDIVAKMDAYIEKAIAGVLKQLQDLPQTVEKMFGANSEMYVELFINELSEHMDEITEPYRILYNYHEILHNIIEVHDTMDMYGISTSTTISPITHYITDKFTHEAPISYSVSSTTPSTNSVLVIEENLNTSSSSPDLKSYMTVNRLPGTPATAKLLKYAIKELFNITQVKYIKMDVMKHVNQSVSSVVLSTPLYSVQLNHIKSVISSIFTYVDKKLYVNAMTSKLVAMVSGLSEVKLIKIALSPLNISSTISSMEHIILQNQPGFNFSKTLKQEMFRKYKNALFGFYRKNYVEFDANLQELTGGYIQSETLPMDLLILISSSMSMKTLEDLTNKIVDLMIPVMRKNVTHEPGNIFAELDKSIDLFFNRFNSVDLEKLSKQILNSLSYSDQLEPSVHDLLGALIHKSLSAIVNMLLKDLTQLSLYDPATATVQNLLDYVESTLALTLHEIVTMSVMPPKPDIDVDVDKLVDIIELQHMTIKNMVNQYVKAMKELLDSLTDGGTAELCSVAPRLCDLDLDVSFSTSSSEEDDVDEAAGDYDEEVTMMRR